MTKRIVFFAVLVAMVMTTTLAMAGAGQSASPEFYYYGDHVIIKKPAQALAFLEILYSTDWTPKGPFMDDTHRLFAGSAAAREFIVTQIRREPPMTLPRASEPSYADIKMFLDKVNALTKQVGTFVDGVVGNGDGKVSEDERAKMPDIVEKNAGIRAYAQMCAEYGSWPVDNKFFAKKINGEKK